MSDDLNLDEYVITFNSRFGSYPDLPNLKIFNVASEVCELLPNIKRELSNCVEYINKYGLPCDNESIQILIMEIDNLIARIQ